MQKSRLNITLDQDLIEYAKIAAQQRITVSELFTHFKESLVDTISRIKTGEVRWFRYDEVF
jgi:hypothetical protein